jgi:Glycosyl transferase family 2
MNLQNIDHASNPIELRCFLAVAAIIPAWNEAATIGPVLEAVTDSRRFSEVVVVNDGSSDNTLRIAQAHHCEVFTNAEQLGKAESMVLGVAQTTTPVICFFDADLEGLALSHIDQLLDPVSSGAVAMNIGTREYWWNRAPIVRNAVLKLGGERALTRQLWDEVPNEFLRGFRIEAGLNATATLGGYRTALTPLPGLRQVTKERKKGMVAGLRCRRQMATEIGEAYISVAKIRGGR